MNITSTAKKVAAFLPLLVFVFLPLCTSAQLRINFGKDSPLRKLQIAELQIANLYVDSIDEHKLVDDAIRGMLEKLDPHSVYTTAKQTKSFNEPLEGSFDGIGVQFNLVQDTLLVIQPVPNGPSERVGILAGDRIVAVNDTAIAGVKMSREEIMRRLRGPRGTKVELQVVRRGINDKLRFTVKRAKIPLKTIDASYIIRPHVGYIRISSFGANTYKEFMTCVDSLRARGMRNLILDLQENGGGFLQSAVQVANEFLQKGDLVVYMQGRRVGRQEYLADGKGKLQTGKVLVLVNEYTASAAEIVTGALQDQDRGMVVGRRTFGKGLVQRPVPFEDGSMIRLTIAHYYTPSGRCIQKPYEKGDLRDYAEDIEKRFKHGELYSADSIHFVDSLKFSTLRKHRTVYGGGGVMPDYFVPLDTTLYPPTYRQLAAKSIIINANLHYVDVHRNELRQKYPTFEAFKQNFTVPQELIDEVMAKGAKEKIKPKDDKELERTLQVLKLQMKALIARDLWDMSEYFEIMNEMNPVVKRALEVLH